MMVKTIWLVGWIACPELESCDVIPDPFICKGVFFSLAYLTFDSWFLVSVGCAALR